MKPLLVSSSDVVGGAARAATRLQAALNCQNIDTKMLVALKQSDNWRVKGQTRKSKIRREILLILENLLMQKQHSTNSNFHSLARFSALKAKKINITDVDIIHLHWICEGCLSVEEIARITKPIVWTMHDMWAFCGAEHCVPENETIRWRQGYVKSNRDPRHTGLDIDRWVWSRKQKAWEGKFNIVTPSQWLADCVKNSALMSNWPVTIIPNTLDINVFKPIPKEVARLALGFSMDVRIILFGAFGNGSNPNKGWDILQPALAQLAKQMQNLQAVIFGQREPQHPPNLGLPLRWMGHLHDDVMLTLLYSVADVMVVPSRQEAFCQTASEAQACGCPVVAFNATGLLDVVEHGSTGYLAEPYASEDLAKGIKWVLSDQERNKELCIKARDRAVRLWSYEAIAPQYLDVYQRALESQNI